MKLYLKYVAMHLRSQMQYKTSFFLTVAGQFISSFSALLGVYFLMDRFHQAGGFSYSEVLLCLAVILMAFSLAECFVRGFDAFSAIIANGEFDRIMVRPRNEILQVLGARIEFSRMGRLLQALCVFAYAVPRSGISWNAARACLLPLMVVAGAFVFAGLFIIYAALCFFTTEGLEFINIFTDGGREFCTYPLSIYGERILKFFTCIVPLALVQYYPLLYLTGRSENWQHALAPAAACLFLPLSLLLWRVGLRHYKSTGS